MHNRVMEKMEPCRIHVSKDSNHYGLILSAIIDSINDSTLFITDKVRLAVSWYAEILEDEELFEEFEEVLFGGSPEKPYLYNGHTIPQFAAKYEMPYAQAYANLVHKVVK